ncbi:TetR/AcrR family transcriptional regulator [Agrobacterium vitis]|uniref:TetR family transcriptional regulator n=1 Tax=Agrobacterium vitis TaxID=373 RepID=A0AAE4WDM0_AGRVI|nr:TetR/AcrR family transcriptional regulator [Agrobacterium vitis]MCF1499326.1 TetR/AcrR family transcriptional regulator [Allorhizobium sp. Av2]MCM2439425.1 TetR/AcrR family transcriptional regulator [Agrobacterium vitis]MUZ57673.1 TetR family transcriptional regulator [Agrobacterium vitis]
MSTKRQDIIDAANRTFYRYGFAEIGIDRVTGEANVALGTLYRHFKTRSDVIAAALGQRHDDFLLALGSSVSEQGAECVLELFDVLAGWSDEHGGNGCFFLRAAADYPTDEVIRNTALIHKRKYRELIEERLRQGGWPNSQAQDLADVIFVLLEGAVASAFTLGDRTSIAIARKTAALVLASAPPVSP